MSILRESQRADRRMRNYTAEMLAADSRLRTGCSPLLLGRRKGNTRSFVGSMPVAAAVADIDIEVVEVVELDMELAG